MRPDDRPVEATRNDEVPPRGEATLTEQRRALRRQVQTLEKIDDMAARTVRITALVVGFVVTGAGVASQTGSSVPPEAAVLTATGLVFLLSTVILGVFTTGETGYKTRLTAGEYAYLQLPIPPNGAERRGLRERYRVWTAKARRTVERNSHQLAATQRSFVLGIVLVATGGLSVFVLDPIGTLVSDVFPSVGAARLAGVVLLVVAVVVAVGAVIQLVTLSVAVSIDEGDGGASSRGEAKIDWSGGRIDR